MGWGSGKASGEQRHGLVSHLVGMYWSGEALRRLDLRLGEVRVRKGTKTSNNWGSRTHELVLSLSLRLGEGLWVCECLGDHQEVGPSPMVATSSLARKYFKGQGSVGSLLWSETLPGVLQETNGWVREGHSRCTSTHQCPEHVLPPLHPWLRLL